MCEVSDWLMLLFLGVCSISDLRLRGVKTWVLTCSTLAVLLFCIFLTEEPLWSVLCGAGMGLVFFGVSYLTRESMGYADSWLILLLGIYLGLPKLMLLLSCAFLSAGVMALVGIALKWWKGNGTIAFIPFLALSYMGVMFR